MVGKVVHGILLIDRCHNGIVCSVGELFCSSL